MLTLALSINLLLLLSRVLSEPSVDISISPPTIARRGDKIRVTCYATGLSPSDFQFKSRLYCPILSKDIACFQECNAMCQRGTGCNPQQVNLMSAIRCQMFKDTNSMKFQYEFRYNDNGYFGHYMCQFFKSDSARVLLSKPVMPPSDKPVTITMKPPAAKTTKKTENLSKNLAITTTTAPARRPERKTPLCGIDGQECTTSERDGESEE